MIKEIVNSYTVEEIHDAYMSIHGSYLPCDKSLVNSFIKCYPNITSAPNLEYVANILVDYVGMIHT